MLQACFKNLQGMALVSVAWVLLILAFVAMTMMSSVRYRSEVLSVEEIRAKAKGAAEGAIYKLLHKVILSPNDAKKTLIDSSFDVGSHTVKIKVSNESGLVNLNRADASLLSAVFASQGVNKGEALNLAARILDWRDSDDLKRFGGAEAVDYRNAGLSYGPRNSPFETLGELTQVKGVTNDIFVCVAPLFTVYSASESVNLNLAPDSIKKVLEWAEERNWQGKDWSLKESFQNSVLKKNRGVDSGDVYSISASTLSERKVPFKLRVIVRFTENLNKPFHILDWREVFNVDAREKNSCRQH